MKTVQQFLALFLSTAMVMASLSGCYGLKESQQTGGAETEEDSQTAEADSDLYMIEQT